MHKEKARKNLSEPNCTSQPDQVVGVSEGCLGGESLALVKLQDTKRIRNLVCNVRAKSTVELEPY